jgi:3'(2'), 5'-bisphosphate nucleotidase
MMPCASLASDRTLLDGLSSLASVAGAAILAARAGSLQVQAKPDQSPVTAADLASEATLLEGISRLLPGVAIVSEEAVTRAPPSRLSSTFVLLDPLDGTRELIAGRDEFAINVAVVIDAFPCLGIIAAPAKGILWRGTAQGGAERLLLDPGAQVSAARERASIRTRACPPAALVAAVSRSHFDARTAAFLDRFPHAQRIASGSALKFCRLAEGGADLYPRLSTTCEWDVAAGHALLVAAGGTVLTCEGRPLTYGQSEAGFLVPGFVAWGDPSAPKAFGLSAR